MRSYKGRATFTRGGRSFLPPNDCHLARLTAPATDVAHLRPFPRTDRWAANQDREAPGRTRGPLRCESTRPGNGGSVSPTQIGKTRFPLPVGRGVGRGVVTIPSLCPVTIWVKPSPGFCQTHARDRGGEGVLREGW